MDAWKGKGGSIEPRRERAYFLTLWVVLPSSGADGVGPRRLHIVHLHAVIPAIPHNPEEDSTPHPALWTNFEGGFLANGEKRRKRTAERCAGFRK